MNESAREELNRIIAKGSTGLSDNEIDFLYARREYLNKQQREDFKGIIKQKDQEVANAVKTADDETKA